MVCFALAGTDKFSCWLTRQLGVDLLDLDGVVLDTRHSAEEEMYRFQLDLEDHLCLVVDSSCKTQLSKIGSLLSNAVAMYVKCRSIWSSSMTLNVNAQRS